MVSQAYDVSCLMCGTEVGEIRNRRFIHHLGCERLPAMRGGILRCCRCGGSLYLERADSLTLRLRRSTPAEATLAHAG